MYGFKDDYYRMTGNQWSLVKGIIALLSNYDLRYLLIMRFSLNSNLKILCKIMRRIMIRKYGLNISTNKIGRGLYLGHAQNIDVNKDVIIGDNCNLNKGVTIGQENRGIRKGSPILGNKVWCGVNSTIVGKVKIGDNVLIAPNSYVNCDIPSNSIVIGNPCKIIHREDATYSYICNCVET